MACFVFRLRLCIAGLLLPLGLLCCLAPTSVEATTSSLVCPSIGVDDLTDLLTEIKFGDKYFWNPTPVGVHAAVALYDPYITENHPGVSATYVKAFGAEGLRHWANKWPMLDTDPGRIASCSKAFTATLVAMLVEQKALYAPGKALTFDTKLGDLVQATGWPVHSSFKLMPLRMVINNLAGFVRDFDPPVRTGVSVVEQRRDYVKALLSQPPATTPGGFVYSNTGYVFLGFVVDFVSKKSWEALLKDYIFSKLGLTSAGVGPIGTDGKNLAPYGHVERFGEPNTFDAQFGNGTPYKAPCRDIFLRARDHAAWTAWHVQGLSGGAPASCPSPWKAPCLSASTFRQMHAPGMASFGDNQYAMGWTAVKTDWSGVASQHTGAMWGWHSEAWVMPEKSLGVTINTNYWATNQETGDAIFPTAYLDVIAQELTAAYTLPGCPDDVPTLLDWQYSNQGGCSRLTTVLNQRNCVAKSGTGVAYRAANTAAMADNRACAASCVADRNCRAWSFRTITSGSSSSAGCWLIRSAASSASTSVYTCTATNSPYISGEVASIKVSAFMGTSMGAAAPASSPEDTLCSDTLNSCASYCAMRRQSPNKCNGFTWNASTRKCFLFTQTALKMEQQPVQAHCVLYSGLVTENCSG